MKTRFKLEILNVFLGLAALVSPLFAQDPVVSVTVKNLDTFGAKLTAAAEDIGDVDLAKGAAAFKSAISDQTVKDGINTEAPVGVFLFPNGKKNPPIGVAVVSVKDIEKVLKHVPDKYFAVEKKGDNSWEVKSKKDDSKFSAIIERQGDWFFVQDGKSNISIADCGAKLVELLTAPMDSDVQAKFYVNAIPQNDRKEFVNHIVGKARKCLEKKGEKKFGKELNDRFLSELEKFVESAEAHEWKSPLEDASVSYTWDANGKKLVIRNSFTGNGSAHQIQDLRAATAANASALAGFGTEETLGFYHVNAQIEGLNDPVIDELMAVHRNCFIKKLECKAGEETAKEVSEWLTNNHPLFRQAFAGSEQEYAVAMYAEPEKKFTIIFARSVPDGYALEKTFCEAAKYVCEKKGEKCKGHVKNGKRTENGELHVFQADFVPKKQCCEMKKLFPETVPGCVIFAPKAVYWAVGTDAVDTLVKNIQTSKQADAPAFAATVSLQKALNVCCKVKKVSDEKKAKLGEIGDANVTIQVNALENGAEIVTEVPAQVFQAIKVLK
ncbi:MAG: hypothetical protein ACI4UF_12185 [Thermoguttaceae bacterium]